MATPSNKRKQIASVFHFSPASKPLMCTVHRDTGGKQKDITVLWFKPRVRHLSHCGWHFTGFKQELWELLAWHRRTVSAGYWDKRETQDFRHQPGSPGKLALSTSIKNHLELPTIISAFHRRESGKLADIQREWNIIVGEHIKTSSAKIKLPPGSGG